jgi:hypothetical protein
MSWRACWIREPKIALIWPIRPTVMYNTVRMSNTMQEVRKTSAWAKKGNFHSISPSWLAICLSGP